MKKNKKKRFNALRQRAEKFLNQDPKYFQSLPPEDVQKLIHELNVHQIELEMQNEELRRAQIEIEESRDRYSDLYDFAPVGYFTLNEKGLIIEANLTGADILGVERRYLLKRGFSGFITPDFRDAFYLHYKQVLESRNKQNCQLKFIKEKGADFFAQVESIRVQDEEGNGNKIRTAITDITQIKLTKKALNKALEESRQREKELALYRNHLEELVEERTGALRQSNENLVREIVKRNQVEKKLRDSNALLTSLVESPTEVIITSLDREFNYTFFNTAHAKEMKRIWNADIELGKNILNYISSETEREKGRRNLEQALSGKQFSKEEKYGEPRNINWYELSYIPIFDAQKQVSGITVFVTNITRRKHTEATLRSILEATANVIGEDFLRIMVKQLAHSLGFRYVFVGELVAPGTDRIRTSALWANDDYRENFEYDLAGTPCENVVGKKFCFYPDHIQQLFPNDHLLTEMGVVSYAGIPLVNSAGATLGVLVALNDKPMGDVMFIEPILTLFALRSTAEIERKRTEAVLRESERRLKEAQQIAQVGHWELDIVSNRLIWSEEIYRIFGLGYNDFGTSYEAFLERVHPDDRNFVNEAYTHSINNKTPYDIVHRLLLEDGTVKYVHEKCITLYDQNGAPLRSLGTVQDITQRKLAEENLINALAEVERLKTHLQEENVYLKTVIDLDANFEEIIGANKELKKVLHKVERVAPTNSTVLILGETGTGKELIARAVHRMSKRGERPLIRVNCAAMPASLMESEFFGHEKGAFTGAFSRKMGRFELADKGTIFLDEIGDLSLDLQAKLLRVLQDGEFERIGNPHTLKVDVRVLAATNRDLKKNVEEGTFRQDLYYRLNVFPITLPPLRDRKDDIPLLVNAMVNKYSVKQGKYIDNIPLHTMNSLQNYPWPGNVRELENIIERAVILTDGPTLQLEELLGYIPIKSENISETPTLKQGEKTLILKALEECNWVIEGNRGAAKRLDLVPSTLRYRMKILGIKRPA